MGASQPQKKTGSPSTTKSIPKQNEDIIEPAPKKEVVKEEKIQELKIPSKEKVTIDSSDNIDNRVSESTSEISNNAEPKKTEKRKEDLQDKEEDLTNKFARKHDENAIADAKSRYLARKSAKLQQQPTL
jgi:hypothetical protein